VRAYDIVIKLKNHPIKLAFLHDCHRAFAVRKWPSASLPKANRIGRRFLVLVQKSYVFLLLFWTDIGTLYFSPKTSIFCIKLTALAKNTKLWYNLVCALVKTGGNNFENT